MIYSILHKIGANIGWTIFLLVISACGYLVVDTVHPRQLLRFDYPVIPIAREFAHDNGKYIIFYPGNVIPLRLKGYKFTNDVPKCITNRLIGDAIITLPNTQANPKGKGPFDFINLDRVVPVSPLQGLVQLEICYLYSRNFIRDNEQYTIRTEPFMIVQRKTDHDESEDMELIKKIMRELKIKTGPPGNPGPKGEKGDRGPGLFGK
jgi:hypothetical protein